MNQRRQIGIHLIGMGRRTFLRRFVASARSKPTACIQNVGIAKAREAVELKRRGMDKIAWDLGYEDPAAFRKLFKKLTGVTPHTDCLRFGVAAEWAIQARQASCRRAGSHGHAAPN